MSNTTSRASPRNPLLNCDILVVDDNPCDAELTLLALSCLQPQPRARWLSDGREAFECLVAGAHRAPSLVLTDVHMPHLSGLELLRRIRGVPQLQTLPVIVLSCSASADEVAEAFCLGADAYVEKSMEYDIFKAHLMQAVLRSVNTTRPGQSPATSSSAR